MTKKWAYYNEHDKFAAEWIRNLIRAGHVADGEVDERSIEDVLPSDVRSFAQCHWFAGIAGWSYALRQSGWPDDRPVWSGSPPCQPFSSAGKQEGVNDERHLWPTFFRLISACRPETIFGEQVSGSNVTGRDARAVHYLQGLQYREALRRFSYARIAQEIQEYLQGLPERTGAEAEAIESAKNRRTTQGMEAQQQGVCIGLFGDGASQGKGAEFRSGCGGNSEKNRSRLLRDDCNTVRSGRGLESAITGQNQPESRLHEDQCSGGYFCHERNDEQMGVGKGIGDSGSVAQDDGNEIPERVIAAIFGSEPEKADSKPWLNIIQSDLEASGYAFGVVSAPAACIGAPHIRQRLFFVADTNKQQWYRRGKSWAGRRGEPANNSAAGDLGNAGGERLALSIGKSRVFGCESGSDAREASVGTGVHVGGLADAEQHGGGCQAESPDHEKQAAVGPAGQCGGCCCASGGMADDILQQRQGRQPGISIDYAAPGRDESAAAIAGFRGYSRTSQTNGFWRDADWLYCRDGKWRPVESGTFPLVDGIPASMGRGKSTLGGMARSNRIIRLRGYGNAIVPELAAEFIRAYLGDE